MKPCTLSIILLFLLVNILLSKHFLIEVEDDEKKQENLDQEKDKGSLELKEVANETTEVVDEPEPTFRRRPRDKGCKKCGVEYKCKKRNRIRSRIVGGEETKVNQYPWTARLQVVKRNGKALPYQSCGGTLIASQYVLTAESCIRKVREEEYKKYKYELKVTLGEHNLKSRGETCLETKTFDVAKTDVYRHPGYEEYGVALLKLSEEVDIGIYNPVCLPDVETDYTFNDWKNYKFNNVDSANYKANPRYYSYGWGKGSKKRLTRYEFGSYVFYTNASHSHVKGSKPQLHTQYLFTSEILNKYKPPIQKRDEGNPLTFQEKDSRHTLFGIAMVTPRTDRRNYFFHVNNPTILKWITEMMESPSFCEDGNLWGRCPYCPEERKPVCATNGYSSRVYRNKCFAYCEGTDEVKSKGHKWWSYVGRRTNNRKLYRCPYCHCDESSPVCATDGVTYKNDCFAYCSGIEVDYQGECPEIGC